jgi:signal transduction histidine kinase/CheY-like chemotaxis protein
VQTFYRFMKNCREETLLMRHVDVLLRAQDGTKFPVELYCRSSESSAGLLYHLGIVDISDRQRAEEERMRSMHEQSLRVEAELANKIKDEFLAKLSHDLRTPLNAILTWIVLLRSGQLDEEQRTRACETIERNTRLQVKLIADLLDVSAILAGKLTLNREMVDLGDLARKVLGDLAPAAEKKGIALAAEINPSLEPVSCDPARIHQVLNNLLQNAVKFSPASSTVRLAVIREEQDAIVSVVDSGRGIPPEILPHIFDPFRQGEDGTREGGLGLGLAIVKEIVQMHGGEVAARSGGQGRGATFELRLPLAGPEQTGTDDARMERHEIRFDGVKVLVVEDEDDARDWLVTVLRQSGAEVVSAATAQDALSIFDAAPPDLLVSDIGLPGKNGYFLIREIRRRGKSRGGGIPAVAVTAFARTNERMRALDAGFQAHVAKPVDWVRLKEVIAEVLREASPPGDL